MLMPLFDLLLLDNDLQEQWSDEVSVDTNHTSYDATAHHEHQEQLMVHDATIAKRRQSQYGHQRREQWC